MTSRIQLVRQHLSIGVQYGGPFGTTTLTLWIWCYQTRTMVQQLTIRFCIPARNALTPAALSTTLYSMRSLCVWSFSWRQRRIRIIGRVGCRLIQAVYWMIRHSMLRVSVRGCWIYSTSSSVVLRRRCPSGDATHQRCHLHALCAICEIKGVVWFGPLCIVCPFVPGRSSYNIPSVRHRVLVE